MASVPAGQDGVEVLSVEYCGWKKEKDAKEAPVEIRSAHINTVEYEALLRALAVVDSATLKEVEQNDRLSTWHHFLWQARVTANKKTLLDLNWCGAPGSKEQLQCAKPQAAVRLVQGMKFDFKDHALTADDRAWVSAKFQRQWEWFRAYDFFAVLVDRIGGALDEEWVRRDSLPYGWWVRDRVLAIGAEVGAPAAVRVLRDILESEPKDPHDADSIDEKVLEWDEALEAVSRLAKKDVREKMLGLVDYDASRKKALELLKDVK